MPSNEDEVAKLTKRIASLEMKLIKTRSTATFAFALAFFATTYIFLKLILRIV